MLDPDVYKRQDYPTNLYAKYAFGSSLDREPESPPEEYTSIRNQWKENVVQNSTINCFRPYPGERYSIVSDMELLNIKYLFPLQLGAYDDPKGYLDHYREKSRMAVVETYIQVVNDPVSYTHLDVYKRQTTER